ncbi:MAG: NHL repeat-containing protein [Bacteroidota bacterium]
MTGVTIAGGNGRGNAANQFDQPDDIFIDSNNTLYVCDMNNHRVQKWISGSSSGITVAGGNGSGSNPNQLNEPSSVFADGSGAVFIADRNNNRVQKWLPGAVSGVTVAGGNGLGSNANQLYRPDDVFVNTAGNLYIADAFNNRIQKWVPGATSGITVAGGDYPAGTADKLHNPKSIYVDDSSNIFIADYHNHRIQKWHEGDDSAVTVAGSRKYYGSLSDQMLVPTNVHIDKDGNLFIVDAFNARAQKWPNVVDSTFITMSPGNYTAVVKGKSPVCTATSNVVTVNTGYTYQFTGNGNWSDTTNWSGDNLPPSPLPACSKIIVSPEGTCILDVPQTISAGANITVVSGTNFVINGNLTIQ